MRRLIIIAVFSLIVSCVIFLFSPLTFSSNAQGENKPETDFIDVEQTIGKKMPVDKIGIRRLKEDISESVIVSINEATGAASFVRLASDKSSDLSGLKDSTDARGKSDAFFREYASLFGIRNADAELRYEKEFGEEAGEKHRTFRQFYNGVPVFAGELKTHIDKENRLYAVNGTFVPEIEIDTNPVYNRQDAAAVAVAKVSEEKAADGLFAKKTELYVYRTNLIKGVPGNDFLTWQVEVTNNGDVREFVFIDAHTNKIVDQFTGIHDAMFRRAYNGLSLPNVPPSYPATPFWSEGQAFPTTNVEANNMLSASKETYDVFKNAFNRDSFDGSGATMDSIFNRGYQCPNASWNGTFISFCAGLTTDDITAHEWGHAYTQYTHDLIYQWQPGALNESYSDIYGEIVDRINNRDNIGNSATDPARTTGNCSGSTRWRLGEDATGGFNGALRDMYNPNCFGDPGKVPDASYFCSTADQGGVHSNSGVPNHAFALLVDGGTYNGKTINGIGLTKAAHIYFRAMNIYQHSASDFVDHADSVEQSANDLRISGTNLPDLQTGLPSGQIITASDFFEVQQALLAVQMRTLPTQCGFAPLLAKNPPAETACGTGATRGTIFANDFEGSTTDWSFGRENTLPVFSLPNWSVTAGLPDNMTGKAFYAPDPNVGSCNAASNQKGVRFLKSPVIQIPGGSVTNPILSFDHWIATESGYDGGQLLISINGSGFTLVPETNFIYNAYNTTLVSAAGGNDNPRASQSAWSGADGGSVSGSWGKTMVNLTGLVNPGDAVQFRWDLSTDLCTGIFGWYVDNVKVTACQTVVSNSFEADVAARPNGDGSILSDDVVQIRRFLNGTNAADQTTNEFQRADSSPFVDRGDGRIFSDDVVQARRYQNGTNTKQLASGPMTQAPPRPAEMVDQLFGGLSKTVVDSALLGNPREVRVENAMGSAGQNVTVNIRVNAVGNESEYGFIINYDSIILSNPVVGAGTAGASVRSCNIATIGQVNCSVGGFPNNQMGSSEPGIGEIAAGTNQLLITVQFTIAANAQPGTTPLTLSNVNASSDAPQLLFPAATNGTVTILAPTAASSQISGRVVTTDGRAVSKARVTLTDQNGEMRSALTSVFGYYRFETVAAGETYIISAEHKQYRFETKVINVNENLSEINFVASP